MKLLLINPYFNGIKPDAPQLGLYFLGTYIKEHTNWDIEVIDPLVENLTKKEVLYKTKNANLVGLTCFTDIRFQCFDFAEEVKTINPGCKVIVGGIHASVLSEQMLQKCPCIDIIIRGEGEQTLLEIINGNSYSNILGISYRNNTEIFRNPNRYLTRNIDTLHLDYSLMPDAYTKYWKDYEVPKYLLKLNHIPIIASRGCLYNCYYCSSYYYWNGKYRILSPEELVKRMEEIINNYGTEYFRFYDALFPTNKKWIVDFCDLLKERELSIKFRIDIRASSDRKNIEMLKSVGCSVLGLGVESGVSHIRHSLNKNDSQEQIYELIQIAIDLKLWIVGYFMLGIPNEKIIDIKKTIKLIKNFDYHNFTRFQIYPNTVMYNTLKQLGEISNDIWFDRVLQTEVKHTSDYFYDIGASSYCKENFPSAFFYQRELDQWIQYSFDYHHLTNPVAVIKKYGLKGLLVILKALLDIPTKGKIDKLYKAVVS